MKDKEFSNAQKKIITDWILDANQHSKWEDGHDLHIDEVIFEEIDEELWIETSFRLIDYAQNEIERLDLIEIVPIVFIPLYGDERKRGVNFESIHTLRNELDMTPPSLFVCSKDWEGFLVRYLNRPLLDEIEYNGRIYSVYYFEELHDNGLEYVRNISLIPKF